MTAALFLSACLLASFALIAWADARRIDAAAWTVGAVVALGLMGVV